MIITSARKSRHLEGYNAVILIMENGRKLWSEVLCGLYDTRESALQGAEQFKLKLTA